MTVLVAWLLQNFHRKQLLNKHVHNSTSEFLPLVNTTGTLSLPSLINTTTTIMEKCSLAFPDNFNFNEIRRHMYSLNQLVYSPLPFMETDRSYVPPTWFEFPRTCLVENVSCSLPQDSGTPNRTLGQHICDLDTCFPGTVDLLLHTHHVAFITTHHWFSQLHSILFLFVGDSTAGQQYRSFLCLLNDHMTPLQQLQSNIQVAFSWEAYIYNDTMRNTTTEDTFLSYRTARHTNPQGMNQRLIVVMGFGAWYKPHLAQRYHHDVMTFTSWWQQLRPVNATLIWRDALPQHFATDTGVYHTSLKFPLTVEFGLYACRPIKSFCAQELWVNSTRVFVNPSLGIYSLPVHDWAGNMYYGHNIRTGDCTHFCIAVMALWNVFLVRLVVVIMSE